MPRERPNPSHPPRLALQKNRVRCPALVESATCPQCGQPIAVQQQASPAPTPQAVSTPQQVPGTAPPPKVQTVEQTGKTWKGLQAIGGVLIVVGFVALVGASSDGEKTPAIIGEKGKNHAVDRHDRARPHQQFQTGKTAGKRVDGYLGGKGAEENTAGNRSFGIRIRQPPVKRRTAALRVNAIRIKYEAIPPSKWLNKIEPVSPICQRTPAIRALPPKA